MQDERIRFDLNDPYTLAALYKAGLSADAAGLEALRKARASPLSRRQSQASVASALPSRGAPRKVAVATATPMRVLPGTPYFERREFEYRLVSGEKDVYEYNRLKPGGKSFAEGAVADGYVTVGEDGFFSRPHVSYAVLDQQIKRDIRLIGAPFDVALPLRDFAYYAAAEQALLSLDRVFIANDESVVEVVSDGRRWRIKLEKGYRVHDRADRSLYAFVDVETPGRRYAHVELKVDGASREAYLFDRESGIGRVGIIPYQHLSDITRVEVHGVAPLPKTDEVATPSSATSAEAETKDLAPRALPATPKEPVIPKVETGNPPLPSAPSREKTVSSVELKSIIPPPRLEPSRPPVESGKMLGSLRLVGEMAVENGSVERIFELPFGKAKMVVSYRANGSIERIAARSSEFMYPGSELVPDWEQKLARKRREVGKFTNEDEAADLLAGKRVVVERARERMLFRKLIAVLPPNSPELLAVSERIQEIVRETIERYGGVFAALS
jgi:hypothetical protein